MIRSSTAVPFNHPSILSQPTLLNLAGWWAGAYPRGHWTTGGGPPWTGHQFIIKHAHRYLYTHTHSGQREETRVTPYTTQPCGRPTPPLLEHVTYNRTAVSCLLLSRFIGQITWSTPPSVSAVMSLRLPNELFWHVNHDHGADLYVSLALTRTYKHTYARVCPKSWLNLQIKEVANVFVKLNMFNLYTVIL